MDLTWISELLQLIDVYCA